MESKDPGDAYVTMLPEHSSTNLCIPPAFPRGS
jgi:hypothetical protein